ncbi:hypothetical protein [Haladaptatus sp. R4]|uniref:hypothetical protein n=1 Tax=Haladaptatus sp. R4 TaxID=1679489 RepID=UPI000826F32A|nr:hypothetical protein [Haladaptatus sp. R4]
MTDELVACTFPDHVHWNAVYKHMGAVENATDDGTFEAFPPEDNEDDAEQTTVTVTASTVSTAGRTCERDEKNYRTNDCSPDNHRW